MRRPHLSTALLATCIAAACGAAGAADPVASKPADAAPAAPKTAAKTGNAKAGNAGAATPEEVAADPQRVWTRFLAEAELSAAYDHYDVIDAVDYDGTVVDADLCRDQTQALREAVVAAPVSIAVHRVAMLCAEAVDDDATAEREAAALAALSKHALSTRGDAGWHRPIPVLSPRDIYALLSLLGYEFSYEYYKTIHPRRYLPLVVAAWDPEAKVERHLAFDFIDVAFSLDRDDEYTGYPIQRNLLADAFLQAQSKSNEVSAVDMLASQEAFSADSKPGGLAHLREGAARGGVMSLSSWLVFCGTEDVPGCEDGLVDALLPLAERRQAAPMTLLAVAYAEGIGVKRDRKAAEALLDAADKRWHERGASLLFAALVTRLHPGVRNDVAMARLRKAIEAGNADAEVLWLAGELTYDDNRVLTAQEIGVLERPSNNQLGLGYATLAEYYKKRGMTAQMRAAANAAADHGHAASQRARAVMLFSDGGKQVPREAWLKDLTDAAQSGDAFAMRLLASDAVDAKQWKAAKGWLLAAVSDGDLDALYDIADLHAIENTGLPDGIDHAVRIYEALAADAGDGGARGRRRLASLAMDGRGMKRNPKRAVEWLQADATRGDAQSQLQLAGMHLQRAFDGADVAEGRRWIERAIASGSTDAKAAYGGWLIGWKDATREERSRGLTLLRGIADSGDLGARNNLAWALCVSPVEGVRDPAAGLVIAKTMDADPSLPSGFVDTVAACYAATGDFAAAVRLQQRAIDGLPRDDKGKPQGNQGMFDRIELYRSGKAFVDTLD